MRPTSVTRRDAIPRRVDHERAPLMYAAQTLIPAALPDVRRILLSLRDYPLWNDAVSSVAAPPGPRPRGVRYPARIRSVIAARIGLVETQLTRIAYEVTLFGNREIGRWELCAHPGEATVVRHLLELSGPMLTGTPVNFSEVALWRLYRLALMLPGPDEAGTEERPFGREPRP